MTHKFLQVCSLQRALECGRRCFHAPPIWLPKLALHRMPASLATSDCGRTTLTPFERRPPAIALSVPSWGLPSKDHSTAATSPAESVALTTSSRLAAKVSSWRLHEKALHYCTTQREFAQLGIRIPIDTRSRAEPRNSCVAHYQPSSKQRI